MFWIPPSSPSLFTVFPTSPPTPPLLPSAFHSETTTTKASPGQNKHSPESNQFLEVMVQLLQLNTLLTSRIRQSPHEYVKNEGCYILNLSDQTHKRHNSGRHWQSPSSCVLYITCIGNPDDYSLEVAQWSCNTDYIQIITVSFLVFSKA